LRAAKHGTEEGVEVGAKARRRFVRRRVSRLTGGASGA
jgi:hypothetical protein